ncbi:MAG: hypothetical protein ACRCZ0_01495 [Cetobacterium sp.]
MGKISEIIQINRALGSEVNLVEELFDIEKNSLRMSNYMPTKGHREAFLKIVKGLYELTDKRAYILNGSYGTGKSNLLLMIANYLMNNSNSEKMNQFFENYFLREEDEKIDDLTSNKEEILQKIKQNISHLKSIRTTDKPHFIALCKYDISGDFTEILLRAIKEGFERENISMDDFDSIYKEAIRKIEQWEKAKNEVDFYDKLESELQINNRTIQNFKDKLININGETLKEFKELYKKFTLSDFTYEKDNLTDIIKETLKSKTFIEKYSGFTIFFDEFGNILENHRFDELVFQRFTEFCQNSLSDRIPVIFIATTHKSFETYAEYYKKDQFKKVSDRFIDVSLSTEGFEDIISAIVIPNKESEIWKEKISRSREFIELSRKTTTLRLFNGLRGRKLEEKLIKNLYPMHPMATYALLGLSKEVSSNNRSVYSFFTRGGFESYTEEIDIENHGNLNFYTANNLIEYFNRDKFTSSNIDLRPRLKDKIRNYETSRSEFERFKRNEAVTDIKIYEKIMDLMLIYQLLEIPITQENINFGLNIKLDSDKQDIQNAINNLSTYGVIYYKKTNESYEFKQSDLLDVDGIIAEYIKDNLSNELNIVEELKRIKDIRDYSQIKVTLENFTSELLPIPSLIGDYRYIKDLVRVQDIESNNFMNLKSEKIDKQNILTYDCDGYFLYVICENIKEKERALKAIETNVTKNIIFAIPKEIKNLRQPLLGLLAIEKSEKLKNLKQQEKIILDSSRKSYINDIVRALSELNKTNNLELFYQDEISNVEGGNKEKVLLTKILNHKYGQNLPSLDLPLKQRTSEFNSENERSFKEFINRLISIKDPIIYDRLTAGKADDRYLKPLLDSQILTLYKTDNNGKDILETNSSIQVYQSYPALKEILEILEIENINVEELKRNLTQKYALGKYGMYFLLAYIYRYFNGNISFINSRGTNENISSYKDIEEFVKKGKEIKKIKISNREKQFLISLYNLFNEVGTLNQKGNIKDSFVSIQEWYNTLQKYQKIDSINDKNILKIFEKINNLSAEEFLLSELNVLMGKEKDDILSENEFNELFNKISNFKKISEKSKEILIKNLLEKISQKFKSTSEDISQFFFNYYSTLPEFKINPNFEKHTQNSRKFLMFLKDINQNKDCLELLLNYNGTYKNWITDNTELIVDELWKGYYDIEKLYLIPNPKLIFEGNHVISGDIIYFEDDFKIIIENLDKNSYETYYTLTSDGISVIDSFGSTNLKIANEKNSISSVNHGEILCILNQQDSSNKIKKRSNEIRLRFRSRDKQFEPTLEMKLGNNQQKLDEANQEFTESSRIVFDVIPKQKNDLKSAIKGLIDSVVTESKMSNNDVKDILEKLLVHYSRGK